MLSTARLCATNSSDHDSQYIIVLEAGYIDCVQLCVLMLDMQLCSTVASLV